MRDDEGLRVTVGYRAVPEQRAELDRVLEEELRAPGRKGRRTLSKVCEYVMSLGLDLYWARHAAGSSAVDAYALEHGLSRRAATAELIRKGLEKRRR